MSANHIRMSLLTVCAVGLFAAAVPTSAAEQWAGQTFLSDYSRLQPIPGKEGKDYNYMAPGLEKAIAKYSKVMLDQPEVFISPGSPYTGTKPEDLQAIAGAIRSTAAAALQERGYTMVDKPAPDALYIRLAVTDLKIARKKRNLLAYTPVGFVVDTGVKALQGFMDKYDILDMSMQIEFQDSTKHDVLAAGVIQRGKSADASKPISFDALVAVTNEFGERLACRLDNGHVPAAKRIDCTDPVARKARPQVVGE